MNLRPIRRGLVALARGLLFWRRPPPSIPKEFDIFNPPPGLNQLELIRLNSEAIRKTGLAIAIMLLLPSLAYAQGIPAFQTGVLTPNHLLKGAGGNGQHMDAGGLTGDINGRGVSPFSVTDALGLGQCYNSAVTGGSHWAFCLGHDSAGNALMSVGANGGALERGFKLNLNGTLYDFPFAGAGGGITAPATTTVNNILTWNNTTGTLVKDSDYAIASAADYTVYVRSTGADTGNCDTIGTACLTINYALGRGMRVHVKQTRLVVDIGAGTWNESIAVNNQVFGAANAAANPNGTSNQPGQVIFSGAGSASTTWNGGGFCGTLIASNNAIVGVRAMKMNGNSNGCQSTLFAQIGATINIYDDINFGPATIEHIHIENPGSSVQAWFSYTISGGSARHVTAAEGAYIHAGYPTGVITFSGTPAFSSQFVWATQGGLVQFNNPVTFSGTFTGVRYQASANGVISTYPSTSLTWIPGTAVGISFDHGLYRGPDPVFTYGAIATAGDGTFFKARCIDLDGTKCENQTWTPDIKFGGLKVGLTYSSRIAYYAQVGKLIVATFDITLSAKGSSVGDAGIYDLPFNAEASQPGTCSFGLWANMDASLTGPVIGSINSNTSTIVLYKPGAGGMTALSDATFTNTSRLSGVCTYATN